MTTTNIELEQLASVLDIPNFDCIYKNEFNKIIDKMLPLNIIMKLDNNDKSGSHWCLLFIDQNLISKPNSKKIYYSSFGDGIPIEAKEFMMSVDVRKILLSDFQIQDFNESSCGLYCILILYLLNHGIQFEDIILNLIK